MNRRLLLVLLPIVTILASCGTGSDPVYNSAASGSSTSSSSSSGSTSSSNSSGGATGSGDNVADITIDGGPAGVTGNVDVPFVTVTICAPGTSTCQTIDHVILDTGSIGLRLQAGALNAAMRAALPAVSNGGQEIGECYQYADGYVFGSVKRADLQIAGEKVGNMPTMVIGDGGDYGTVPDDCSATGGASENTIASFGANGIIGIGPNPTDCGTACSVGSSMYYICNSELCESDPVALSYQLPNPVAVMPTDNNGTVIVLPSPGATGRATMAGKLYFGIGTQANNGLGGRTPMTISSQWSFTASYKGQLVSDAFLDSGTNYYSFDDATITECSSSDFEGYYCPSSPLVLSALFTGTNNQSRQVSFEIDNAQTLSASGFTAIPNLGGTAFGAGYFDFGLPFFFGKSVYTAISGRNAGGTVGPYVAF
jgi:hypothetical protein